MKTLTSRLYENQHDFEPMQGLLMEERSFTSDWRYAGIDYHSAGASPVWLLPESHSVSYKSSAIRGDVLSGYITEDSQ